MNNPALKGDLITRNPNGYLALATYAAELEREGRYQTAYEIWHMAMKAAKNMVNKAWAIERASLCHTCFTRFGLRGE